MGNKVVWILARPRLEHFDRLVHFTGDVVIVLLRDIEAFSLAYSVAKVESFLNILLGQLQLSLIAIKDCNPRVGHSEIRIQFHSSLVECDGFPPSTFSTFVVTHCV